MAISKKNFTRGVRLKPDNVAFDGKEGELKVELSSAKFQAYLGGASRNIVTEDQAQTLTNKTISAPANTITGIADTNIASGAAIDASKIANGTVSSTEFQYLDGVTSSIQTQLNAKASSTLTSAHIFVGNVSNVATDVAVSGDLTLTNTGDFEIAAGAIINADINAAAAIDASKIANGTISNTEFQYLDGVTSSIQTQLSGKVSGPGSSVDNTVVRFDGTTGSVVQGSTAVIDDAGAASGFTTIGASGTITAGGFTTTGTTATGIFTASGASTLTGTFDANGLVQYASANDAATGSNATLTAPTTKVIRLTSGSLVSIDGIPAGADAREVIIENATGTTIVINEDTGATTANRFYTGTTAGINLADKASLLLSYDTTSARWRVIGGSGAGTGSQTPATFVQLDASELLTTWSNGNNATYLGGGSLSGTFVKNTSTPLNGTASYTYTQAAGSLNDYLASAIQTVPVRFRGNIATFLFPYLYNGLSTDIEPVVYDVTNGAKLNLTSDLLPASGSNASVYRANITIPLTCTQIRVGFQVKALNSAKVLQFDDYQITSDAMAYLDGVYATDWVNAGATVITGTTSNPTKGTTPITDEMYWRRVGSNMEVRMAYRQTTPGTNGSGDLLFALPAGYTIDTTKVKPYAVVIAAAADQQVYSDSTVGSCGWEDNTNGQHFKGVVSVFDTTKVRFNMLMTTGTTDAYHSYANSATTRLLYSLSWSASFSVPIKGWAATNPSIVTAAESFSTDTANLVYAGSATYTPATLVNAPIGTFITYDYLIPSTNTRTQTVLTAPTQTASDMNLNGIRIYTRAYNAASTATTPVAISIQVGKDFKGDALQLYKTATKTTAGDVEWKQDNAFTADFGAKLVDYNATTGILTIDAGYRGAANTSANFLFEDLSTQANGYFVINASKSPALVGVPQVQPRFATLSDVKTSGTAAGASTATTQTRTLTTLDDPTNFVTLASNQFTLLAGEYYIEASAPAVASNSHRTRIRNITDTTTAILGTTENSAAAAAVQNRSFCSGRVVITATKTFELQHFIQTAKATDGLGIAASSGESEVYAIVKITKVK